MDVNGTHFHLLLGRADWSRCALDGTALGELWDESAHEQALTPLAWDDRRNEIMLTQRLLKFVAAPKDSGPALENRRGADRDQYGNWYWIDESSTKVRVRSSGAGVTSDFWSSALRAAQRRPQRPGDFQPVAPAAPELPLLCGLAITNDHFLVVGTLAPGGLLIFDLHAGGAPRELSWPMEVPFAPFDIARRPCGGVWILDRENRCYWALDRHLNIVGPGRATTTLDQELPDDFQTIGHASADDCVRSTLARIFPTSALLDLASPLSALDPIAIESLPDGTVLVLDQAGADGFAQISRYDFEQKRLLDGPLSTAALRTVIEQDQANSFGLQGYDFAFVAAHDDDTGLSADRVYVAASDGNQSFAFDLCLRGGKLELQPLSEHLPMRLFGGKGIVAAGSSVYYDFAENWVPLVRQLRPRYAADATILTPVFDGKEPDCVWHRLMLDACIPPETSVTISSRSANRAAELAQADWTRQPRPYLRADGSELPFAATPTRNAAAGPDHTTRRAGTWELLVQNECGRYLQLKVELSGNERATPRLSALRAYYPRFSYLQHYLPAVYREDVQSASFLERFLANIEGVCTSLEDKIAAVQMLFDVRSAPAEVLEWLASWFGVALDPAWSEAKRRLFIRHALDFFQFRGTAHGIKLALHLALDQCADESIFALPTARAPGTHSIRIVEKFLTRVTPSVVAGDPTEITAQQSVAGLAKWRPAQTRSVLIQQYTDFVNAAATEKHNSIEYPIVAPQTTPDLTRWQQFSQSVLGFQPASAAGELGRWQIFLGRSYADIGALNLAHKTTYATLADVSLPGDLPTQEQARNDWTDFLKQPANTTIEAGLWRDFLARRYQRIKALNNLYGTHWTSFAAVPLQAVLPVNEVLLNDWYQFESVVLAMRRSAHKFSVLVPAPRNAALDQAERQKQVELAARIVNLEKPAHTSFEVKFYWAMFRIGAARLGADTLLDVGSRSPQLMQSLELGRSYVGESFLSPRPPQSTRDRFILGRDSLRS